MPTGDSAKRIRPLTESPYSSRLGLPAAGQRNRILEGPPPAAAVIRRRILFHFSNTSQKGPVFSFRTVHWA